MKDNGEITGHIPEPEDHIGHFVVCDLTCEPLPPETTTPMPPQLRIVAPRLFPKPPPPKPRITAKTPSRWPEYIAKMSPPADSVQP